MKCHLAAGVLGVLLVSSLSASGAGPAAECKPPVDSVIESPGYPHAYPANITCTWVLNISNVFMILDEFNLAKGDFLVVYDGEVKKENIVANLTGRQDNVVMYSAGANSTVVFTSKPKSHPQSSEVAGFKMEFSSKAGRNFTGNSGQILAPLYKKSPGSIKFVYELNVPMAGGVVSLSVNSIGMINDSSLVVLDGDNTTLFDNKGGKLTHMRDVLAKKPKMFVKLNLTTSVQQNLSAAFTSTSAECTKSYTINVTTNVTSPGYPGNYSADLNCRWVIESAPHTTLRVTFNDFQLADSYDHVTLVDGDAKEDRAFGVFNRLSPPGSNFMLTSGHSLWLHFGTDESRSAAGFNLTVEPVAYGGGFADKGVISLNPTGDVPYAKPVYFQLTVQDKQQVSLDFTTMFVGNTTATVTCYSCLSEDPTAIVARFSAVSGLPTLPVFSIDRHMLVVATNFFVKNNGTKVMPFFTATFKAVPQDGLVQTSVAATGAYQLTTLPYPKQATWLVPNLGSQVNTTGIVAMSIGSVILGPRSKLTVYGGTGRKAPVVAEVTSNLTVLPVIYLPSARVVYTTTDNSTVTSKMSTVLVRASYSILTGCGGNLSMSNGVVTTPQYPNQYPLNAKCEWRLAKLKSKKLHVAMTDLALVGNHSVKLLAVNVSSVANHTSYVTKVLASYSSKTALPTNDLILEQTDQLWVDFKSAGNGKVNVARGFKATYEELQCGGYLSADGDVATPGFPHPVGVDTTCLWIISLPATTGKKPRIVSFKYDIKPALWNGTSNTIEIRDGGSTLSESIPVSVAAGKKKQYSRTTQLWIRYMFHSTKIQTQGFAFKLSYKTYDCVDMCDNGVCMMPGWKCDGVDECGDGSDEKDCKHGGEGGGGGVSVAAFVVVVFVMFFLGIAAAFFLPIAYRRFRQGSRYSEFRDQTT